MSRSPVETLIKKYFIRNTIFTFVAKNNFQFPFLRKVDRHPWLLFRIFSNKRQYNFYNSLLSIQYIVLGFKPTTFRKRVSSHNHLTRTQFLIKLKMFKNEPATLSSYNRYFPSSTLLFTSDLFS